MSKLPPLNSIDEAFVGALPNPLYIVDGESAVRFANPCASKLNVRLGLANVLPAEVGRGGGGGGEAIARNQEMAGDDIRHAVHLSDDQTYLAQIFRLPGLFGAHDGWAVLLVEATRLRRNAEANARISTRLSHDIKTPLSVIRLSLHLLLEGKIGALNADQREMLEVGRDECERMLATLHALLELGQLESGRTTLQLVPVFPADLLAETVAAQSESARSALRIEATADLPAVWADIPHANRILLQLLSTARQYGTKTGVIVLRATARAHGIVRFSILTSGVALTEPERAQLFEPFSRGSAGAAGETGVDLAVCRELALLHGGGLGVTSRVESDRTEFYFDLRCVGNSPPHATASAASSTA